MELNFVFLIVRRVRSTQPGTHLDALLFRGSNAYIHAPIRPKQSTVKHYFFLLLLFSATLQAQPLSYSIPAGYEKDISQADYKILVDLSVPLVAKRYAIEEVKDGTMLLKKGQGLQALNLHNLIAKCMAERDKTKWAEVVQTHFDNLFSSLDAQKKIDPANFETIRSYLSLRVYPVATVEQRGGAASMVARKDLDGTLTLLMLDLPGAFTAVQRPVFASWKKDSAAVFGLAQENVNKQAVQKVTQLFEIDGSKIEISFLGNEDYAASYALDLLHNSPELVGEWGSVIAMPNKGLVNICKISPDKPVDFVKFIQRTLPLIEKSFRDHPQPISANYFWYYKGSFTPIRVLTDGKGQVNVLSPSGLTALMTEKAR